MILTITGLPGNAKTLYTLVYVKAWADREQRPVYYYGIKGLKMPTEPTRDGLSSMPWTKLTTELVRIGGEEVEVPQWWLCPAKSIVVIDEAQSCGFGVRQRGVVPPHAQKLETHRHLGLDLVFITQHPSLIDSHDRKLSERHFHLVRRFGRPVSTVHQFNGGVRDAVEKPASRKDSIKTKWPFPKHAFAWYESAEAHTHKKHVPMRVYVLMALPVLLLVLVGYLWFGRLDPARKKGGAAAGQAASAPGANVPGVKLTAAQYVQQFAPRVDGLAYTAPIYDEVTKPIVAPYPAACVVMESKGCKCFSQQGTRLETPAYLCKSIVEGGFFVAWAQPKEVPASASSPMAQQASFQPAGAPIAGFGYSGGFGTPAASKLPPDDPTVYAGRGKALPPPARPPAGP